LVIFQNEVRLLALGAMREPLLSPKHLWLPRLVRASQELFVRVHGVVTDHLDRKALLQLLDLEVQRRVKRWSPAIHDGVLVRVHILFAIVDEPRIRLCLLDLRMRTLLFKVLCL